MALPTIQKTDFIGSLKIASNDVSSMLNDYITEFNKYWLRRIVGASSFDFINTTTPLPDRYTDLLGGVSYENSKEDKVLYFEGIKEALKRLIYFEYQREHFTDSTTGKISARNENSVNASLLQSNSYAVAKFNEASDIVCNGEKFIEEYTGQKRDITGINDLGGGILEILVNDTKYLIDGNTVTINDVDYVVSSVVADTSFQITSTLIDADAYYYDAFPEIVTDGGRTSYSNLGIIVV